ncbi:MAG: hypothetical protein ACRDQ5_07525 [Sciscionella sp.]
MAGYDQSSGAMASSAQAINGAVDDARGKTRDLAPTQLRASEFGRVHTAKQGPYATGFDRVTKGVDDLYAALGSFTAKLGGTAKGYDSAESGNTDDVNKSGGS